MVAAAAAATTRDFPGETERAAATAAREQVKAAPGPGDAGRGLGVPDPIGGLMGRRLARGAGSSQPGMGVAAAGLRARGTRPDAPARGFCPAPGRLPAVPGPPLTATEPRAGALPGLSGPLRWARGHQPLTLFPGAWRAEVKQAGGDLLRS